jgi:hypothetical protein
MNVALTMEEAGLPLDTGRPLEGAVAFLASRSKKFARQLTAPMGEVLNGFAGAIDQILLRVIEKRTAEEFSAAYSEYFPKYAAMTLSLSQAAHAIVPADVIEHLTRESICEVEADFRDRALEAFGADVRDQVMFTVFTLRKINELIAMISSSKPERSKREKDKEYCLNFNLNALRAHFALDCLSLALRQERAIYPEVMEELKDSLRAMVNAYAWARQGAAIRFPADEEVLPFSDMGEDEEDRELLHASMLDMASMECEDEGY